RTLDAAAFGARLHPLLRRAHTAIDLAGLWLVRRRRRRTLAEIAALGEHVMHDLGFDPDELRAEAAKPFWRD
ncbi:MAG: DUF1127 domain-containing protein, partial [Rhodospirillales bacterium]